MGLGFAKRAVMLLAACLTGTTALAQTGVAEDRVSLPDGPGSFGGLGENASVGNNSGQYEHSIPLGLPMGHPGASPSLALRYNSGAGNGVVGMGWAVSWPTVERMTSRGLPRYTLVDRFAADGGQELVLIPGSNPPVYRARFEGGFVRYTWLAAGTGDQGYWKAESPDGKVMYYGATASGTLVPDAREGFAAGTFRYHVVESVDPDGHRVSYSYTRVGNTTLLASVDWLFNAMGSARNRVTLTYEGRPDALSDCKPGFCWLLQRRLKTVAVTVNNMPLHSYELTYETVTRSGGGSRLERVEQFAGDGTRFPQVFTLTYSRALGGVCNEASCGQPLLRSMGSLGVNIRGDATLVDINGDALPDVVETPASGAHRFFVSQLQTNGMHTYATAASSAVGNSSTRINAPSVQLLDVNGDGFADLASARTGQVLYNTGNGDWSVAAPVGTTNLPDFEADAMDGQISIRFLDYDNDKRIDVIRALTNATSIWRNTGDDFVEDTTIAMIGAGFAEDRMQFSDMNGDNLLDAVVVFEGGVRYRLNLGWGQWEPWANINNLPISAADVPLVELEDLNGDGLSDLVLVTGNQVQLFVNRNAATFDPPLTITSALGGSIPVRDGNSTVLYADMNGNGSSDVVWVGLSGDITYLELFPVRPNLLARIESGLGSVITVSYVSAVELMARDEAAGRPWAYKIPMSMLMVDKVIIQDLLTGQDEDTTWSFHDAFYDGVEKQFRGFARVETSSDPDATQEGGRNVMEFDLGIADRYRAGLKLLEEVQSSTRPIRLTENTYADCPLTGVPTTLTPPVRFVCLTQVRTTIKEGQPQSEWVVLEEQREYDGYGNVTRDARLGVTSVGGGGCAPCTRDANTFGVACGAMCLGDEQYTETEFADPDQPGGGWLLRLPTVARAYGRVGGEATETRTYYDGPDYVGLPLGEATLGHATRTSAKVRAGAMEFIDLVRQRFDSHGNPVEVLDANATTTSTTLRRQWNYDAYGLHVTQTNHPLVDQDDQPYVLRREYRYDPLFDQVSLSSDWFVVQGATERTPRNNTVYAYDVLGRLITTTLAGEDPGTSTTQSMVYDFGSPLSRLVVRQSSVAGMGQDLEEVHCHDGNGREYQMRNKLDATRWQVSGFVVHNRQGQVVRQYHPYIGGPACDTVPPAVAFEENHLDALGRVVRTVFPDAQDQGGTASETRTVYLPLTTEELDEQDTVAGAAPTPTRLVRDGLNRVVQLERRATVAGGPVAHTITYDEWGNIKGIVDPLGQERLQEHDLLGRVTRVTDSTRGSQAWTYDAHGSPSSYTDARGTTLRFGYDGANRVSAQWQDGQEATTRVAYTYDLPPQGCPAQDCSNTANRATQVTYPSQGAFGMDVYGYSSRGDPTFMRRSYGGATFDLRHEYDNAGRLTRTVYPKGMETNVAWSGNGRVTNVAPYIPNVTYNDVGALDTIQLQNGLEQKHSYDRRIQVSRVTVGPAGGGALVDLNYTRNRRGHVTRVVDGAAVAGSMSHNAVFQYDGLSRLTSAQLDQGTAGVEETLTFDYDGGDRILAANSSVGASRQNLGQYTYDATRPYLATRAGTTSTTHDAAGNTLTRGNLTLTWDHQGRLTQVNRGTANVGKYGYGPQSQRILKQEGPHTTYYPTPDFEVRDGIATLWVRLGDIRIAKVERAGWAVDLYTDVAPVTRAGNAATPMPDNAINAADAWVAQAGSTGVFTLPAGTTPSETRALLAASARAYLLGTQDTVTFLHQDHMGNTVATTDMAGALVEKVYRFPFGATRSVGAGAPEDRSYTGKEEDEASGFIAFGERYLDPQTGRWLSADPAFDAVGQDDLERLPESSSPYAYVGNNPINFRDRQGKFLDFGPVGAVVGAVVSVAMECLAIKNRGDQITWKAVAVAAAVGAVSGGFGGLAGVAVMAIGKGVEMVAYRAADHHFQKKVEGGSLTPAQAHSKATMWSKIAGIVANAAGGGYVALTAGPEGGLHALKLAKAIVVGVVGVAVAKYGPKLKGWAKSALAATGRFLTRAATGVSKAWTSVKGGAQRLGSAAVRGLVAVGKAGLQSLASGSFLPGMRGGAMLMQGAMNMRQGRGAH